MQKTTFLSFMFLFLLTSCAGGPFTSLGKIGWYSDYGLEKRDLRNPESIPKIEEALSDSNPKVILEAMHAISKFGSKAKRSASKLAVPTFTSYHKALRLKGRNTLQIIGYNPQDLIPSLENAILTDNDNIQKEALVFFIGQLDGDSRYDDVIPAIQKIENDERESVSNRAKIVLQNFKNREKRVIESPDSDLKVFIRYTPTYYTGYTTVNAARLGIMPIKFNIINTSERNIQLSKDKVYIIDDLGVKVNQISSREVFNLLYKPYISIKGVRANNQIRKQLSEEQFQEHTIAPTEEIRKIIFCRIPPDKQDLSGYTIRIVGTFPDSSQPPCIVESSL